MRNIVVATALAASLGCRPTTPVQSTPAPSAAPNAYGLSAASAVEVCEPNGERKYLQRLRCPDGSAPTFQRRGSGGSRTPASEADKDKMLDQMFREGPLAPGEPDLHVIDYYEVKCGAQLTEIVMDMYHCHQAEPEQAPPGFTIVPPQ